MPILREFRSTVVGTSGWIPETKDSLCSTVLEHFALLEKAARPSLARDGAFPISREPQGLNSEGALDRPLALGSLPPGVLLGPAAHSPGSEDYVALMIIRPGSEAYPCEFLVWREQSQFAFP